MRNVTREQLERLGLFDATVRAYLTAQRHERGITWERMLQALVVALAEEKAAWQALANESLANRPPAPIVIFSDPNDPGA